jgi:hypothetical protein
MINKILDGMNYNNNSKGVLYILIVRAYYYIVGLFFVYLFSVIFSTLVIGTLYGIRSFLRLLIL